MPTEFNIIGDIAGQHKTLLSLLEKMPSSAKLVSVGDMIDRGPYSKQVLQFVMKNGIAVLGNHEHIMIDCCSYGGKLYGTSNWILNGGTSTLLSFYPELNKLNYIEILDAPKKIKSDFPEILQWLENLPLFFQKQKTKSTNLGLLVTHAPIGLGLNPKKAFKNLDLFAKEQVVWNRYAPHRIKGKFQVFGHNSHWGLRRFSDQQGEYAICIDTSREKILTGIHWPSMEIFQQQYVD